MEDFFQDGIQEFIKYEKDVDLRPSRADKRKIKLQKLRADLKDPIQRRQRAQMRRKVQKEKLQKQMEGMNEQQIKAFLHERNKKKKQIKQRNINAIKNGLPILIDLVYQHKMNEKENKSLASQIQLIMKVIKRVNDPPGIHLCSVSGGIKAQLEKMKYQYWTLSSNQQDITQVGMKMDKKLIYLSPDAPEPLNNIEPNTAYVIGGLVDRTVIKNASLKRAAQLQIESRHLPIRQYMKNRTCLNLDHVVMMLCKFKQTGNWQQAFDYAAPKRWKKSQKGKQSQNSQDQNEYEIKKQINKIEQDSNDKQ